MPNIIIADLTARSIDKRQSPTGHYGRGLAIHLLRSCTPAYCSRLSSENALVIAPGLFTGSPVPCATRAVVAARGDGSLAVSSITGDMPQKLASLDMAAVIIKGRADDGNAVLYIDAQGASLLHMPELQGLTCGDIVEHIRSRFGSDCAIIGTGPAADRALPLSGLFTTYPEGTPRYTCPRSSFGDVPGSKGLRAVIVKGNHYFEAPCADRASLQASGKELARYILDDPICGGALPGLGSITILHLLKSKQAIPQAPKRPIQPRPKGAGRVNYCCAPMCVIGCLNRHSSGSGRLYAAPEEAEVRAAMDRCFADAFDAVALEQISSALSTRGLALGLNTTEFVYTAALYLSLIRKTPTENGLMDILEEVAAGTMTGRLIGSGTAGIGRLYPENTTIQSRITRPANQNDRAQALRLAQLFPEFAGMDDLNMLYRQIFLMENLGICIFSSFALLNKKETLELLAKLYTYKTGYIATASDLLHYAGECLEAEEALQRDAMIAGAQRSIPEFVKVLYRYFGE